MALNNSHASSEELKNLKENILKINDPLFSNKNADLQSTMVYLKNWNEWLRHLLKRYYKIPFLRFRLLAVSLLLAAYFILPGIFLILIFIII